MNVAWAFERRGSNALGFTGIFGIPSYGLKYVNWTKMLKKFAPSWAKAIYRQIRLRGNAEPWPLDKVVLELLKEEVIGLRQLTVFDVGANQGQSIGRFESFLPRAVFHTFEPIGACYAKLLQNFTGPKYFHNRVAVSDEDGWRPFHELASGTSSSFHSPNLSSSWAVRRAKSMSLGSPEELILSRYEVSTIKLDTYAYGSSHTGASERVHLLKIDTQGHENSVLAGAAKLLSDPMRRPYVIETELILGNTYLEQRTFSDIEKLLTPFGYALIAISRGGNVIQSPDFYVDLLFAGPDVASRLPS